MRKTIFKPCVLEYLAPKTFIMQLHIGYIRRRGLIMCQLQVAMAICMEKNLSMFFGMVNTSNWSLFNFANLRKKASFLSVSPFFKTQFRDLVLSCA